MKTLANQKNTLTRVVDEQKLKSQLTSSTPLIDTMGVKF
jgi:hypothetical protein